MLRNEVDAETAGFAHRRGKIIEIVMDLKDRVRGCPAR